MNDDSIHFTRFLSFGGIDSVGLRSKLRGGRLVPGPEQACVDAARLVVRSDVGGDLPVDGGGGLAGLAQSQKRSVGCPTVVDVGSDAECRLVVADV